MQRVPTPSIDRLVRHLVGEHETDPMARELAAWLAASPRYRRFAERHRDKVRKKLRVAGDDSGRLDVRSELRVASLLLADRRIDLAFEARGSARGGPDFTVTFRDRPACFLEVTRLRRMPDESALGRAVVAKLRQLPPSMPSVLVLAVDGTDAARLPLDSMIRTARARVDAGDADLLSRGGFEGPRAFYQRFLRLAAVIGWCEAGAGDGRAAMWVNPSAQLVLPDPVARACLAALRGDGTPARSGRSAGQAPREID